MIEPLIPAFRRFSGPIRTPAESVCRALALCILMLSAAATIESAQADDTHETLYNVFSISAEADAEIRNDLMSARLVVQAEAKDTASLANEINDTMRWALAFLVPFDTIDHQTLDYRTWPRHDTSQSRRLLGWRGTQTLQLESDDIAAMSEAISKLQERLQVENTTFGVKPASRRKATDTLIDAALHAFKQRAERVQANLGAPGYRIVDVNIQTDEHGDGGMQSYARAASMESADYSVSEPGLEAGVQRIVVRIAGRIQLE